MSTSNLEAPWPVDVESSLAVVRNMTFMECGVRSTADKVDVCHRFFDAARILLDAEVAGSFCLIEPEVPELLTERAVAQAKQATWQERRPLCATIQAAHNIADALPALVWLGCERREQVMPAADIANQQLANLSSGLKERYTQLVKSLNHFPRKIREERMLKLPFGQLFEGVVLGMVSENEDFREANIIGVPASPPLEKVSATNESPVDIALFHLEDKQATFVGGLQCKGIPPGSYHHRGGPHASTGTVYIYGRKCFRKAGKTIPEIIETWLEGDYDKLEYMHASLAETIKRSHHDQLKELLGYS